jgi:hypothetical protein
MLDTIITPIDALRPLEDRHKWLMQVLLSYADRDGRCWPSLRKIAERAGKTLSWVQRNLAQMESLGYFTRNKTRRFQSLIYQLAERFFARPKRPQPPPAPAKIYPQSRSPADRTPLNRGAPPPAITCPQRASPTGGTQRKKEYQLLDSDEVGFRRFAAPGFDVTGFKRRRWLKKLHAFVGAEFMGRRFSTPQWYRACELIQGAEQGTLDPAERRELNGISERMNLSGFRPAMAA